MPTLALLLSLIYGCSLFSIYGVYSLSWTQKRKLLSPYRWHSDEHVVDAVPVPEVRVVRVGEVLPRITRVFQQVRHPCRRHYLKRIRSKTDETFKEFCIFSNIFFLKIMARQSLELKKTNQSLSLMSVLMRVDLHRLQKRKLSIRNQFLF